MANRNAIRKPDGNWETIKEAEARYQAELAEEARATGADGGWTPSWEQPGYVAPAASASLDDPEQRAQLEFYAAMSGMPLEQYLQTMADDPNRGKQAPQLAYEAQQARTPEARRKAALRSATDEASSGMNDSVARESADVLGNWNETVTPALGQQRSAVANQQSSNRLGETELRGAGNALNTSLGLTQDQRQAGIGTANAAQNQALSGLLSSTRSANSRQDQALDALSGQMGQANNAQINANNQLQGDLAYQTLQGNDQVAVLTNEFNSLNDEDKAGYMQYLQTTNPMLAAQVARGSDARYVQQQQDVHDRFKELSNPAITAQERFVAEQARLKFENDDKSSREAVMADMAARGVRSGGTQIAAQLANRQATSQDRRMAELGLSAQAQGRAFSALGAQGDIASQLRNADDGMRNFQDQYAQNDMQRRQNLALQQNQQGLASTAQRGDRTAGIFDAGQRNLDAATNRSGMAYDANTGTIGANANRDAQVFDANTTTIDGNANRDAGAYAAQTGTINSNFDRSGYGWDSADSNARTGYDTSRNNVTQAANNRAGEVGSAQGMTGSSIAAGTGYAGVRGGIGSIERDALNSVLKGKIIDNVEEEDEN